MALAAAAKLVEARLLTTGNDATGAATIEVAHESLITAWPLLRRLAEEHAKFTLWYDGHFAPWLRHWAAGSTATDLLLRGPVLLQAEHWLATAPELLAGPATEFIHRSAAERTREAERQRAQDGLAAPGSGGTSASGAQWPRTGATSSWSPAPAPGSGQLRASRFATSSVPTTPEPARRTTPCRHRVQERHGLGVEYRRHAVCNVSRGYRATGPDPHK